MRIDLRVHRKLQHSWLSDVFAANGQVYKVFKRLSDPPADQRAVEVFDQQCSAYRRAGEDPILKQHVPEFYGLFTIEQLVDENGQDVSEGYRLGACYVIEELSGREAKVTAPLITDEYPYISEMRKVFDAHGIRTEDASVFNYDDPEHFKFIDFS
jgi:hypothetical protein